MKEYTAFEITCAFEDMDLASDTTFYIEEDVKKLFCCGNCSQSVSGRWYVFNPICLDCVKFSNWNMKEEKNDNR